MTSESLEISTKVQALDYLLRGHHAERDEYIGADPNNEAGDG